MTKEGLSAASGIIGLAIVFAAMAWVACRNAGDTEVLIALAATLPRQIEMTHDVHHVHLRLERTAGAVGAAERRRRQHASGVRSGLRRAHQVRPAGAARGRRRQHCRVARRRDGTDPVAQPTGRINVRGANGSGKSTLLDQPEDRGEDARLLLADRRPAGVQVRAGHGPRSRFDEDGEPMRRPTRPRRPASPPASGSCARCGKSSRTPTRRSICWTNGTPISIPTTAPPPTRWSKSWRGAPAWSRFRTATAPDRPTHAHMFSTRP